MAVVPTSAGVAFALVCVAGLCAPLGASVVIFMKRGQRKLLASAIALAAGVMIFVSLTGEAHAHQQQEAESSNLPGCHQQQQLGCRQQWLG
jgi:zinc transporter ZupT